MKRSDIDDQHVIDLARAWHQGTFPDRVCVVDALIAEGIPPKLAYVKVLHLVDRGLLDCGVSVRCAWPVEPPPQWKINRDAMKMVKRDAMAIDWSTDDDTPVPVDKLPGQHNTVITTPDGNLVVLDPASTSYTVEQDGPHRVEGWRSSAAQPYDRKR